MTKLSYDQVSAYIKSKGDTLLSTEYKGTKFPLDILCGKCGEEYKQKMEKFQRGVQHGYCGKSGNKKFTFDEVKKYIESQGDELLSPEYKNSKTILDIKCGKCGKEYQQTYGGFKRGYQHAYCGYDRDIHDKRPQSWIDRKSAKPLLIKKCIACGKAFAAKRKAQKSCNRECHNLLIKERAANGYFKEIGRKGGIASVKKQQRRSKNEIYFSELCEKEYGNISTNDAIFGGWDADVVLPNLKISILWNGIWHFKKVKGKHDPEDVRRRDKLKVQAIKDCGYIPYIIKDMGKYNKKFVDEQFEIFKKLVESKEIYHNYNDLLKEALNEPVINELNPIIKYEIPEDAKVIPPPISKPVTIEICFPEKPKKIVEHNKCKDCEAVITPTSERCDPCYRINSRKVERPSLEILLEDVENLGWCGTGRKYGVTDNAIRKWVKQYRKTIS